MRVAYFTPGLGLSGGVRIILEHVQRLYDSGEDVVLINYNNNGAVSVDWFECSVPIYTIRDSGAGGPISLIGIDASSIDIVVVCLWFGIDIVDRINGLSPKKKVYFIQGRDSLSYPEVMNYMRIGAEKTYTRLDMVPMCVSSWLADVVNSVGNRDDAIVIGNGIDRCFWAENKNNIQRRKILLLEGSSGEFHKNIDTSLLIAKYAKEITGCDVWWVSKNNESPPEYVDRFICRPSREEMRDILKEARVLLKTTMHDGFGLPHIEAMASGCGLVTTDAMGNMDFCKHNKNCMVTPQNDVRNLLKCVIIMLEDEIVFKKLTTQALKTVDNFAWDKVLGKIKDIFYN